MDFINLRAMSVFILANSASLVRDRKRSETSGCLPENVRCIPLSVVIMTTANEMHPMFSEVNQICLRISDIFRSLPTSHGVCLCQFDACYIK